MLAGAGIFHAKCHNASLPMNVTCDKQDLQYNLMLTMANSIGNFVTILWGALSDSQVCACAPPAG